MTKDGMTEARIAAFRAEVRDKLYVVYNGAHSTPTERTVHLQQCEDFLVKLFAAALIAGEAAPARDLDGTLTAEEAWLACERNKRDPEGEAPGVLGYEQIMTGHAPQHVCTCRDDSGMSSDCALHMRGEAPAHLCQRALAAEERCTALRAALKLLNDGLPQIDNGYCAICRIGDRSWLARGAPGKCSNKDCLSHVVKRALAGGIHHGQ